MLALALMAATAAPAPVVPGTWQVSVLVQGGSARAQLLCRRTGGSWLALAFPTRLLRDCLAKAGPAAGTQVALSLPCLSGGTLEVSGTARSDAFDLVARRRGRVGANPRAAVSLSSQGRLVAARCADGARLPPF